jgi:NAD+ synthase (glutamine-hydrolysing)
MTTEQAAADLRIVMAQLDFMVGDVHANADKILHACVRARDELAADVIVFPELALTGYPPEDLLFRKHFIEYVEVAVEHLCREVNGITAIIGYPLRQGEALYNVAGVICDGGVAAVYRKQRLPNYSVFDEKRYFTAGDAACVVNIRGIPVGITICEDIWDPAPARQAVTAGAHLLVNINASPFHAGKRDEREHMLRQRAVEIGLPMLYVASTCSGSVPSRSACRCCM